MTDLIIMVLLKSDILGVHLAVKYITCGSDI